MATPPPASFIFDSDPTNTTVRVLSLLGEGSFGSVYACSYGDLAAALKIEPRGSGRLAQVPHEVAVLRALAAASVENVPRVLYGPDTIAAAGCQRAFVMTLAGESVEHPLARAGGTLPLTDVARMCADVLRTLEQAHSAGIAHRDGKVENICQRLDGHGWLLVDWGLAAALGAASPPGRPPTVVGTARYASFAAHDGVPLIGADDVLSLA